MCQGSNAKENASRQRMFFFSSTQKYTFCIQRIKRIGLCRMYNNKKQRTAKEKIVWVCRVCTYG